MSAAEIAAALAHHDGPLGIAYKDLPDASATGGVQAMTEAIRSASELGAVVLLLGSVALASPALDAGELREVRAEAARAGVRLQVSLGSVHPARYDVEAGEAALVAAEMLGAESYHIIFGRMTDRFAAHPEPSWGSQLASGVAPLRALLDRAERDVILRTHEEMTTFELNQFSDAVARPNLRVGYSGVNVVTRLEDPLAAWERVADRVACLFLDDHVVTRTADGLARRLCPLGEGFVPWDRILADAHPSVVPILDIHQAEFDMPFHDRAWLSHHPDLEVDEFIAVIRPAQGEDPGQTSSELRREHGRAILRDIARLKSHQQSDLS